MLVAALGGTVTEIGPWYRALAKPSWTPADWVFPVAWTLIYMFATAAAVIAWRRARTRETAEWLIGLFALNGFLNIAWSFLFFKFERPDYALAEVALLWLSIAGLIAFTRRFAPRAAVLLLPYLAWVTAAALLNLAVVRLNPPFS